MSGSRAIVEDFAHKHGLMAEWEGEVGFGRECVGLLDPSRGTWIAYRYDGNCGPEGAPDAFDKSDYIAVLGRGAKAEEQLANWIAHLTAVGARFEYVPKYVLDLGTLVYGHRDELCAVNG